MGRIAYVLLGVCTTLFAWAGSILKGLVTVPFDLTVILGIISILLALSLALQLKQDVLFSKQVIIGYLILIFIFIYGLFTAVIYGSPMDYAIDKILRLITINLVLFILGYIISNSEDGIKAIMGTTSFLAIIIAFKSVFIERSYYIEQIWIGSITYITSSRLICEMGIIAASQYLFGSLYKAEQFGYGLLAIISTIAALNFGARGPLVAYFAVSLFLITLYLKGKRFHRFKIFTLRSIIKVVFYLIILFFVISILYGAGIFDTILYRFDTIAPSAERDSSTENRLEFISKGIELWLKHPIVGNGVASFGQYLGGEAALDEHPHNIFLEILIEFGGIGLFGLVLVFCWPLTGINKYNNPYYLTICALLVLSQIEFLFSSLIDMKSYFLWLGVAYKCIIKRDSFFLS